MRFFLCTAVFLVLIVGPTARGRERFPEIPEKKRTLLLELGGEWYDSIANYTSEGKFVRLPAENFFQYLSVDPRIKYTPYRWVSLSLSTGLMYGRSGTYNRAGGSAVFRDRLQFADVATGVSFHKKLYSLYLTAGVKGIFPLNGFDRLTENNIITGDGAFALEPEVGIIYALPLPSVYVFYRTSFKYRTQKLSALSFHKAGGFIQMRRLSAGMEAGLFFPLIPDAYTNRPETRWKILEKVNGSSYKFFSVNPSALSFTVWMGFKPTDSFEVKLYADLDTYGQYYGKGYTTGLLLSQKMFGGRFSDGSRFKKELRRFKYSGEKGESAGGEAENENGERGFPEDEDVDVEGEEGSKEEFYPPAEEGGGEEW